MRLSAICFFKKTVPGHIFRGKYRLVKPVSKRAMETQIEEYQRQDKIMHLLRYPYLTSEESSGHTKPLDKKGKKIAEFMEYKMSVAFKRGHVTLEDRLNHLKVKEAWD